MSELNKKTNIPSQEEALEILLKERADQQRKAEWTSQLKKMESESIKQMDSNPIILKLRDNIIGIAAAIVVCLLCALFLINNSKVNPVLIAGNHLANLKPVLVSQLETRGSHEGFDEQTALVENSFKEGLYEKIIFIYEDSTAPLSAIDQYYLANAYVLARNPNYQEALKLLTPLTRNESLYLYEALWMKALCHVALEEKTQAKLELENLRSLTSFKSKEIKDLLEAME